VLLAGKEKFAGMPDGRQIEELFETFCPENVGSFINSLIELGFHLIVKLRVVFSLLFSSSLRHFGYPLKSAYEYDCADRRATVFAGGLPILPRSQLTSPASHTPCRRATSQTKKRGERKAMRRRKR